MFPKNLPSTIVVQAKSQDNEELKEVQPGKNDAISAPMVTEGSKVAKGKSATNANSRLERWVLPSILKPPKNFRELVVQALTYEPACEQGLPVDTAAQKSKLDDETADEKERNKPAEQPYEADPNRYANPPESEPEAIHEMRDTSPKVCPSCKKKYDDESSAKAICLSSDSGYVCPLVS